MIYKFGLNCIGVNSQRLIKSYPLVYELCHTAEYVRFIPNNRLNSCCKTLHVAKNYSYTDALIPRSFEVKYLQSFSSNFGCVRFKSSGKKKKGKETEDSDSDEDDDDDDDNKYKDLDGNWILEKGKNWKDSILFVQSLRMDIVARASFGISRNKVDESFYGGKFKLNKGKPPKKSSSIANGDILDYFKTTMSDKNDADISRVKILKIQDYDPKMDKFTILARKYPKLTLEEYEANEE